MTDFASDAVDLSTAVLTPRSGVDRARTTAITRLDLNPNGMHIEFSKRDGEGRWPSVPWGNPGDSLQYTVWVGAKLGDTWHIAASLNVWYGLDNYGGPMATPQQYSSNLWYLDGALGPHTPAVGEPLAFFVTAGGDRATDAHIVFERSNVVVVPMPGPSGASYVFDAPPPVAPPAPQPAPTPVPVPVVSPEETAIILAAIADLRAHIDAVNAQNAVAINTALANFKFPSYAAVLFGTKFTLTPQK